MEYQEAFVDLAGVYLEDSWVLDILPLEHGVAFKLDVVLTPDHPRYQAPVPGEQYCYRRALLTVTSTKRSVLHRSDAPPATDASGELDLGNIDVFVPVDSDGDVAWELSGDWGELVAVEPSVDIAFE